MFAETQTRAERRAAGLTRWHLLAGMAIIAAALAGLWLARLPVERIDIGHYIFWTRLVTTGGIESAYTGVYPHTYAIYPPVVLYFFKAVGHIYQSGFDPTFDLDHALVSPDLAFLITFAALGFHLVLGLVLFILVDRKAGPRMGFFASAAYALNPAALFDIGIWSQPDAAHSLFLVLAVAMLQRGAAAGSWVAFALAALTKPQAWVLAPLLGWATLVRFKVRGLAATALATSITVLIVTSPFLLAGRLSDLLGLPAHMDQVMPVISANAHNVWWLVTGANPAMVPDTNVLWDDVTYRTAAIALVGLVEACALLFLGLWGRTDRLGLAAVFVAFGWFMVTSRAHENHAFMVLPLLALVWHRSPALLGFYVAMSATLFTNMIVHDPGLAPMIQQLALFHDLRQVQLTNAAANLVLFGLLTLFLLWSRVREGATRDRG